MAERKVDVAVIGASAAGLAGYRGVREFIERLVRIWAAPHDTNCDRAAWMPHRVRMGVRAARLAGAILPAAAALVVALAASPRAGVALAEGQFDDPFAYCAAVGTVDAPDARYAGPALPEAVARGLQAALGAPAEAPLDTLLGNSIWRCMAGKVYACTIGANLPCAEKADTRTAPSAAVSEFCRQNPGADVIPMVVTGRATVFEWRCVHERPTIVRQFAQPDAAGYLANIWYPIAPATVKGLYSTRLQPLRRAGGRDRRCYVPLREAGETSVGRAAMAERKVDVAIIRAGTAGLAAYHRACVSTPSGWS